MKLKNLAFFGVMASILSVASAQAEGDIYIASKAYVDRQVSGGVNTALTNYSTAEEVAAAIEVAKAEAAADATSKANAAQAAAEETAAADATAKANAAQAAAEETAAADATSKANAAQAAAEETAAADATTKANTAEQNAKGYTDEKLADYTTTADLTDALNAKQDKLTFDTTPTTGSANPVTSGGVRAAITAATENLPTAENVYTKGETDTLLSAKANSADVYTKTEADEAFDAAGAAATAQSNAKDYTDAQLANYTTTTDLTDALNTKADKTALDNYATTEALNTGLATKQDTLTFDAAPTAGSTNPVTSAGIKTAIDAINTALEEKQSTVENGTVTATDNKVVTGVTTTAGVVTSVSSTLIANANIDANAEIAPSKLNLSKGDCPEGKTCLLTYDSEGNYAATPIEE